jgi:5-methylcytosine-specific restriction endonuclease McrA
MAEVSRTCSADGCDETFVSYMPNRLYCSDACRRREKYHRRFARNPDYYREKARKKNARDPESNRERVRKWRESNPNGYQEWRERNPEYHREWRRQPENAAKHRDAERTRRARKIDAGVGEVNEAEVFRRDGWVCQLCGEPVDKRLVWPDPLSASLDHVVPLSLGGEHSPFNCQLAHLRCNVSKGNRVTADGEQLRLIG